MNRKVIEVFGIVILLLLLSACNPAPKENPTSPHLTETYSFTGDKYYQPNFDNDDSIYVFYRQIASYMDDETGWYFQFCLDGMKDDFSVHQYSYHGTNLRYRYPDGYWSVNYMQNQEPNGEIVYMKLMSKPGIVHFGQGGEAQLRDAKIKNKITDWSRTPQQLLDENPNQYEFEVLDKTLFFTLMHEALTNPPCEPGNNMDQSGFAMDVEPDYLDGYKFQIGWCLKMGKIDAIYIDVLYKTGSEYNEYVQLSDMVDADTATDEQKEAFALIRQVRQAIQAEDSFMPQDDSFMDKEIGGIDFYRLYVFLQAIASGDDYNYSNMNENPPRIREYISKEEFDAAVENSKR